MCRQKKAAAQFQLTSEYTVELGNNSRSSYLCGIKSCSWHVSCKRRDHRLISKGDGTEMKGRAKKSTSRDKLF